MFAQVIRFKLKPDAWPAYENLMNRWRDEQAGIAPGFKGAYVLRDKQARNVCIEVVLFENEELASQNSNRPETNAFHQEMVKLVDGEVEFVDTEVVDSYLR